VGAVSTLRRRKGEWGGSRAQQRTAVRARGGGDGLLREGEGGGVGQAGREAKAQEDWRWPGHPGGLGRKGGPSQFGCSG
jgi:hypothetical protein